MNSDELRSKLERLQVLVINAYIEGIETGDLHARDMAPVITLLNQNKVVSEKPTEDDMHKKVKKLIRKN